MSKQSESFLQRSFYVNADKKLSTCVIKIRAKNFTNFLLKLFLLRYSQHFSYVWEHPLSKCWKGFNDCYVEEERRTGRYITKWRKFYSRHVSERVSDVCWRDWSKASYLSFHLTFSPSTLSNLCDIEPSTCEGFQALISLIEFLQLSQAKEKEKWKLLFQTKAQMISWNFLLIFTLANRDCR